LRGPRNSAGVYLPPQYIIEFNKLSASAASSNSLSQTPNSFGMTPFSRWEYRESPTLDTAECGSVSVAVSFEASSIFDASFPTDEDGYKNDEDTDPPASIMVERPSHNSASSVKKGKRPVQPTKARSRPSFLGAAHPKQSLTAPMEEECSAFTTVNPHSFSQSFRLVLPNTTPFRRLSRQKRSLSIARCHCRGRLDMQTGKLDHRGVRPIERRVAPGAGCTDNERCWRSRRIPENLGKCAHCSRP
jgi:hypothetical protein